MNKYLSVGKEIKPKLCAVLLFVFEAFKPTKPNKRQDKGKPKVAYV